MELGLKEQPLHERTAHLPSQPLQIIKKHPNATVPSKGSDRAAGFYLYSTKAITIPPQHIRVVDTGIAAIFPPNTYGRITSCDPDFFRSVLIQFQLFFS